MNQDFFHHFSLLKFYVALWDSNIYGRFLSYRILLRDNRVTGPAATSKWNKYYWRPTYGSSFHRCLRYQKQSRYLCLLHSVFQSQRDVNHLPVISVTPRAECSHCSKHSEWSVYVQTRQCFSTPASLYYCALEPDFFFVKALKSDSECVESWRCWKRNGKFICEGFNTLHVFLSFFWISVDTSIDPFTFEWIYNKAGEILHKGSGWWK